MMTQFQRYSQILNYFETVVQNLVSSGCAEDIAVLLFRGDPPLWAKRMIDASSKIQSGILVGHHKWLGMYDECLSVQTLMNSSNTKKIKSQYCTAMLEKLEDPISNITTPLYLDVCVPTSCTTIELKNLLQFGLKNFNLKLDVVKVTCLPPQRFLDVKAISFLIFLGLILGLMVFASFLDIWITKFSFSSGITETNDIEKIQISFADTKPISKRFTGTVWQSLLAFSVYTNGRKILNTSYTSSNLDSLHGIRFFSLTWIMLGHLYTLELNSIENLKDLLDDLKTFPFQAIINATFVVDTFFVMSGLLVSYLFFKSKLIWTWNTLAVFYFHRFWRLTPVYMMIIVFYVCLLMHTNDGPLWYQKESLIQMCKDNWWTNLLYINNFVNSNKMCLMWSWYLANDMQFYIVSPLLLIPLLRKPKFGISLIIVITIISIIVNGLLAEKYVVVQTGVRKSINGTQDEAIVIVLNIFTFGCFLEIYVKPYCRISAYLIGLMLGYLLYKTNCTPKINKWICLFGWIVSSVAFFAIIFATYKNFNNNPMTQGEAVFYVTISRPIWAFSVAWLILACISGKAGFINTFLSWKFWAPFSRLSYVSYLIHPLVMDYYYSSTQSLIYYSTTTMIFNYAGMVVIIFILSFIISLVFESPMMALEKLLMKTSRGQRNAEKKLDTD